MVTAEYRRGQNVMKDDWMTDPRTQKNADISRKEKKGTKNSLSKQWNDDSGRENKRCVCVGGGGGRGGLK